MIGFSFGVGCHIAVFYNPEQAIQGTDQKDGMKEMVKGSSNSHGFSDYRILQKNMSGDMMRRKPHIQHNVYNPNMDKKPIHY